MAQSTSSPDRARRALITGASSGIGEAAARLLASEGYRVALLARRADELERVRRSLDRPDEHLVLGCDVTDDRALAQAVATVAERFGGLDLLVNNAGRGHRASVVDQDPEVARRLLDLNVVAPLFLCRLAKPLFTQSARPVVINVASVVARRGLPTLAAYSASKSALVSIGEALRLEWRAEGIAVCSLSPGRTRTPFFQAQSNPRRLSDPDLHGAWTSAQVAAEILALDRRPRPERVLLWRWRLLGILTQVAPRWIDRVLARRFLT